jgi:hypothetical protein
MILIVKRPTHAGGGWGYLGEEAGDECEPPAPARSTAGAVVAFPAGSNAGSRVPAGEASAADTLPVLTAIADAGAAARLYLEAQASRRREA